MQYMAVDRVGNRHVFPLTYPSGHAALLGVARIHLLFYIPFGAPPPFFFLASQTTAKIFTIHMGIRR